MKILFLDIDGVLNTDSDPPGDYIDPAKVALVDEVCRRTGARVVISSEWRIYPGMHYTAERLRDAGLTAEILGATTAERRLSDSSVTARTRQISRWLQARPAVGVWAVLDDLDVNIAGLVRTDPREGVTRYHVERLVERLGEEAPTRPVEPQDATEAQDHGHEAGGPSNRIVGAP